MSSLKIERDVQKTVVDSASSVVGDAANQLTHKGFVSSTASAITEAASGKLPGTSGNHPISGVVGTAITGGRQNAGTKGYLAVRLSREPL